MHWWHKQQISNEICPAGAITKIASVWSVCTFLCINYVQWMDRRQDRTSSSRGENRGKKWLPANSSIHQDRRIDFFSLENDELFADPSIPTNRSQDGRFDADALTPVFDILIQTFEPNGYHIYAILSRWWKKDQ